MFELLLHTRRTMKGIPRETQQHEWKIIIINNNNRKKNREEKRRGSELPSDVVWNTAMKALVNCSSLAHCIHPKESIVKKEKEIENLSCYRGPITWIIAYLSPNIAFFPSQRKCNNHGRVLARDIVSAICTHKCHACEMRFSGWASRVRFLLSGPKWNAPIKERHGKIPLNKQWFVH